MQEIVENMKVPNRKARMKNLETVVLQGGKQSNMEDWSLVYEEAEKRKKLEVEKQKHGDTYELTCKTFLPLGARMWVHNEKSGEDVPVLTGEAVRTKAFDERYAYVQDDLGPSYTETSTVFKVWAPTAIEVRLQLHRPNDLIVTQTLSMQRQEKGIWCVELHGDQRGLHYTYAVFVNEKWNETADPYAKSSSANGECSVVIKLDERSTRPKRPPFQHPTDAIIYEAHIRDMTSHLKSGVHQKGLYQGLSEKNSTTPSGESTGLSHLTELGVTHVQLLPVHDFGSVDEKAERPAYNWGYDAIHHFIPEGSYSSNPDAPEKRVREYKQVIDTLHEHGLRVVMDVVFNHFYKWEKSSLEKIVPGYYFRYEANGELANGTGVGNDTASERKMMRKYIIDSVVYWAKEYKVDGFRFDLMGIHDWETMNEVRRGLDKVDPTILIYGEGWDMPTPLSYDKKATMTNHYYMDGIGFFNDRFRDALKGSHIDIHTRGFINGNKEAKSGMERSLHGSIPLVKNETALFNEPDQTINYIECHDNLTLWDQLEAGVPEATRKLRIRMHRLGIAAILCAQGIPFLHAGQEFCRTKYGHANSYNAPEWLNQMDWERKNLFYQTVEYTKGLIQLRKNTEALRLRSASQIRKRFEYLDAPPHVVAFRIKKDNQVEGSKEVVVILNGAWESLSCQLPNAGVYQVYVDEESASLVPLRSIDSNHVVVSSISAMVLCK